MTFTTEQIAQLDAPLARNAIKSREQSGRTLSYIEGWHAIAEANRIFGFDGWTRETVECRLVAEHARKVGKGQYERDGWGVSYVARVRVTVKGIVREGIGAGHGIDADLGLAHESAIKEAETDAMKRALMTFGNPFGLALYDKAQEGVEKPASARSSPSTQPNSQRALAAQRGPVVSMAPNARDRAEAQPLPDKEGMLAAIERAGSLKQLDDLIAKPRWTEALNALFPPDRPVVENAIADQRSLLTDLTMAG